MMSAHENISPMVAAIEGYAARYNERDLNGDVVARGAFDRSLDQNDQSVAMLYQHDTKTPIGRWLSFENRAEGLWVRGELILGSDMARNTYALIAARALDGLSIGYKTVRAQKEQNGRRIIDADLWEISVVTFPMALNARIHSFDPPGATCPPPDDIRRPAGRALNPSPLSARQFANVLHDAATIFSS